MTQVIEEEYAPAPLIGEKPNETEYNKHVSTEYRVPWKNVQRAIDHGYIIPGYNVQKYIRSTWEGIKNWQRPEDKTVKMAFHMIDVWGRQGSGKSSLVLLLMYQQYKDWDTVLKRIILTKEDLVKSYTEIRGLFQRIPILCLDDLTTMIPKQLWFVDKDLHILIQQFIAVARTKIGTLVTTLPNVEFTWETLGEVVTMEIIVYPNQTYQAQLYCWDSHSKFPLKARFDKIIIESAHFNVSWIPQDVWKQYRERREQIADTTFQKLADYIEGKQTPEGKEQARKQVGSILRKFPNGEIMELMRKHGIKVEGQKGNDFITEMKRVTSERFGSTTNE